MKVSSRNKLKGKVTNTVSDMVNAEVTIDIGGGHTIVGVITKTSLEDMDIKVGDEVTALIKASSVILMKD